MFKGEWKYNKEVDRLFVDSKKVYDSVGREFCITNELGKAKKKCV